jgi:C-terminal processing protease CtpA/Prc
MEVLSINGHAASDLLKLMLAKMPADGFIETGKKMRLGRSFGQIYWLFIDQSAEFTVLARDAAGKTITARLPGVLAAGRDQNSNAVNLQIKANLKRLDGPPENVSLLFLPDPDIARLRIRSFEGQDYPDSIRTAFRTLRGKGTQTLLLDLRGNGGGADEYGALLVAHLTDKPFRYFERIHMATVHPSFATWGPGTLGNGVVPDPAGGYLVTPQLHTGVAVQQPAAEPFLGKVFVLADGGTFSTAADVTAILRQLKRATFVGEETGGGYEGNTSGFNIPITLPNSKLRLRVQMYQYWNAVSGGEKGRGTRPDHLVEKRVADLLRGLDAPWEKALTLARAATPLRKR